MKKIFKLGTKVIKKATINMIDGIDEGFNGDYIKEVRQERREIRRIEMDEENRREKIVTYFWRSA